METTMLANKQWDIKLQLGCHPIFVNAWQRVNGPKWWNIGLSQKGEAGIVDHYGDYSHVLSENQ